MTEPCRFLHAKGWMASLASSSVALSVMVFLLVNGCLGRMGRLGQEWAGFDLSTVCFPCAVRQPHASTATPCFNLGNEEFGFPIVGAVNPNFREVPNRSPWPPCSAVAEPLMTNG